MLPSPHQKVDEGGQAMQGHGWPKGPLGAMRCVLLSPGPEGSGAWVAQGDEMAPWAQGTGERWTAWSLWLGKRTGKPCRAPRPGTSPAGVYHYRVWPQVLRLPGAQTMTPLPCHHAEQAFCCGQAGGEPTLPGQPPGNQGPLLAPAGGGPACLGRRCRTFWKSPQQQPDEMQ